MRQGTSRRLRLSRCLTLILWVALVPAQADGQEGFSHAGDLLGLRLSMDGSDVNAVVVGDPGVAQPFSVMALGPDGRLFAVSRAGDRLYAVDPETADATLVGEIDLPNHGPSDMTFDDEGQLWLLAISSSPPYFGTLYQVDHLTAAITEIVTGMVGLTTLGFRDGTFYSIVGDSQNWEFSLVSINTATGDLTPVVELSGFEPDEPPGEWCMRWPHGMAFDDRGRLWVAATWRRYCIIVSDFKTGIHFYANPLDGSLTSRSLVVNSTGSLLWLHGAFAVRGPALPVVDIPTLSFGGALILAIALAAAAMALARRRY